MEGADAPRRAAAGTPFHALSEHAPLRVAFLGPFGTFSEEAARAHFAHNRLDLLPCPDIPAVLREVQDGTADAGIVPLENSFEGTVVAALDALVHDFSLVLIGEEILPIRQMLLAPPQRRLEEIDCVCSHPQALAQCRQTLARLLPGVKLEPATSTAEAARRVAEQRGRTAAIGPRATAALYGLNILAEDVQDSPLNATRFGVVGRHAVGPTGYDKTSIVFAFPGDRPGNLYQALGEFATRGINLTKVESRPARQELGAYLFFADLEGHAADPLVADALTALRARCSYVHVLGAYPRARTPKC